MMSVELDIRKLTKDIDKIGKDMIPERNYVEAYSFGM